LTARFSPLAPVRGTMWAASPARNIRPYCIGSHTKLRIGVMRPAHIHFSLLGRAFAQRLVTQMYFPGDPLFPYDPIFNSIPDDAARRRLVSRFSILDSQPDWSLAYEWDIYLRGPGATPFQEAL